MLGHSVAIISEMSASIPASFRKLVVKKLTPVFKEAVEIVQQDLIRPCNNEILIKNKYVGINASDVNMAAGRYFSQNRSLPFGLGFESIGEIVDVGEKVAELKIGESVMHMSYGAFSEYVYTPEEEVISVASAKPELLPLLVSGATASLSLDKCGHIVPGEKVLITAAAGGTGHIAVQWAKNVGCYVIGTCSTQEKVKFLEDIGCDRPINYNQECLNDVLTKEYPGGIDVIWETIGEETFNILSKHLAVKGRLVIAGAISKYIESKLSYRMKNDLPMQLLLQSATLSGFLLPHFKSDIPHYLSLLVRLMHEKKIKLFIDDGSSQEKPFNGLEDIVRAMEYLYSGKNKGKVIVAL
ncbi:Zinc-binding alcohol dehydrogenase domain-containing protein 2, partial [Stegodyphus mimosarum]